MEYRTKRLKEVTMSSIRAISDKAKTLEAQGEDVTFFVMGEPNFNTPEMIKEETIKAIQENKTHYTSNRGVLALREQISKKIMTDTGVYYNPETEIIVTNSGAEAINNGLFAFLNEGDEVILLTPCFLSYANLIRMCGAKIVEVPLHAENGFQLDVGEIEEKITIYTKMIIMNNPSNPTGVIFEEQSLLELSRVIEYYNLLVFSDEIYNNLVYDKKDFCSIASFPKMRERTIMMNGFSKTYAMTGWRVGYLAFPEWMNTSLMKVHQYSTTTGVTFIQEGLAKSMNEACTLKEIDTMRQEFDQRRKLVMHLLDEIGVSSYIEPKGAFYIMIDVTKTGWNGEEFVQHVLEEAHVAFVPAKDFGKNMENFIRMSYAASQEEITKGLFKLKLYLEEKNATNH